MHHFENDNPSFFFPYSLSHHPLALLFAPLDPL